MSYGVAGMMFIKVFIKRVFVLLLFYQVCRLLFYAFNYHLFAEETFASYTNIVWGSLRFDMSALMYLNCAYLLMLLLPFPFRFNKVYQAAAKWIFIVVNSIGIIANLADIAYYPFILRRTNAAFFLEFKNDTNLLAEVWKFLFSYWYVAILGLLLIWLLAKTYSMIKMPERDSYNKKKYALDAALLPFMVLIWLGFARGSFVPSNRPINISYAGDYVSHPASVNLVINTPFSIMMTLGNIKIPEVNYFAKEELEAIYNPLQSFEGKPDSSKKNVVIIIVESLSKEFVASLNSGKAGYKGYTPFVDTLIAHSLTFDNTLANSKRSIEGLPSIVASIPSLSEAYVLTPYSGNKINSIASVLKTRGYHTSFFHGAHEGSMGFSAFMKMAGFQHSFSKKEFNNDDLFDGTWGIWDEEFLQYWCDNLNTFPQPFCSAIFTVSSHHPFKLPARYKNTFEKGDLDIHPSVQYTDHALKLFFEKAAKSKWYNNTVFVLTADHAASFAHYPEYNNSVGVFSVPMVFFTPDSSLKGFEKRTVQQQDIFPSLVDYLGLNDTIMAFGKSVLKPQHQPLAVNYFAGIYQAFTDDYLLQFDGEKPIALFKYRSDVLLQNNLLQQEPEAAAQLLKQLKAYIQQYASRVRNNRMLR